MVHIIVQVPILLSLTSSRSEAPLGGRRAGAICEATYNIGAHTSDTFQEEVPIPGAPRKTQVLPLTLGLGLILFRLSASSSDPAWELQYLDLKSTSDDGAKSRNRAQKACILHSFGSRYSWQLMGSAKVPELPPEAPKGSRGRPGDRLKNSVACPCSWQPRLQASPSIKEQNHHAPRFLL